MRIINFGSLNIDYVYSLDHIVKEGETISASDLTCFFGGKGLNQSLALARANNQIYHCGYIGVDGLDIIDILKSESINTDFMVIDNNSHTGSAIVQKDIVGNNCIIVHHGANYNFSQKFILEVLNNFGNGDYIVLQNEINEVSFIIEKAKEKGMIVFFNPAPFDNKVLDYPLELVDFIILNKIEALSLLSLHYNLNISEVDLIKKIWEKYNNSNILLTLGDNGSIYYDGKNIIKCNSYQVDTVDTTGAGDTYIGYFVSGLISQLSIEQSMDLASAAAALSVTKLGAEPSIPKINEVINFKNNNKL